MAALTEKQAELLLDKNFASVATLRPDGSPHSTPVWVDWDGGHILFNTAVGRAKEKHLRRDARVAVLVYAVGNPYQYVSVSGTAELVEGDEAERHIDKLAQKYTGRERFDRPSPDQRRVLVKVRPERVDSNVG